MKKVVSSQFNNSKVYQDTENSEANLSRTKNPVSRGKFKDLTMSMNKKSFNTVLQSSNNKKQDKNQEYVANNRSQLFNSTMERINAKTQIKRFMATQAAHRLSSNSKSLSQASSNGKAVVRQVKQNILNR